jgi:hypothetical protein
MGTFGNVTYDGWCSPFLITPDRTSPNGWALDLGDASPCSENGDRDWYVRGAKRGDEISETNQARCASHHQLHAASVAGGFVCNGIATEFSVSAPHASAPRLRRCLHARIYARRRRLDCS